MPKKSYKKRKVMFMVRIEEEDKKKIEKHAKKSKVTIAEIGRCAISEWLEKYPLNK